MPETPKMSIATTAKTTTKQQNTWRFLDAIFFALTSCLFAFKKKKAAPLVGNFMDLFVCENMALCCFSLKSYNFILLFCTRFCVQPLSHTLHPSYPTIWINPIPTLDLCRLIPDDRWFGSCVFGVHVCFLVFVNFIRRSLSLICRFLHSHSGMLARFMCTALPNDKRWCVSRNGDKKKIQANLFLYISILFFLLLLSSTGDCDGIIPTLCTSTSLIPACEHLQYADILYIHIHATTTRYSSIRGPICFVDFQL